MDTIFKALEISTGALSWTEDYDFALGTGMYPNIESISTKL
jgi:hypothetical protein